jgi:hypothetical protein
VLSVILVIRLGAGVFVLRRSPTHLVVSAIEAGAGARWAITTAVLAASAVIGLAAGFRACSWALRRPTDASRTTADRHVRRRPQRRSQLAELIAVDRSSVWRASALRRGGLVLALLPSIVAVGGAIPWQTLVVLPGLVAAGAGLLFGINSFSLDGSGALWLASLPHDPSLAARAKLHVLAETVGAGGLIALLTGSLRSPGSPTTAQLTAMVASYFACGCLVIATCMALSVRRPHRADLRGPRDAVAPPGALAAASARLALPAGLLGLILEAASQSGVWWLPPLLAAPVVAASLMWLRRTLRSYADPVVRSGVVHRVATG